MTRSEADVVLDEAEALWLSGEKQRARECCLRAQLLHHEAGDPRGEADALSRLGDIEAETGHGNAARHAYVEARQLYARDGDQRDQGGILVRLARLGYVTPETRRRAWTEGTAATRHLRAG